ncbi:hypothetical protein [Streptomyces melanogenes]|uniref:hypothetical protein n=1 Tax=Streptomyces melanogenes TaxID=67326 RepID=UPI0037B6FD5F
MSELSNHTQANHHPVGETCIYAQDLRPGDRLSVLSGWAVVREAGPADKNGWVSVLIDVCGDGPMLIGSDTVLSVRRPEPVPESDGTEGEDDPDVTVTVDLTVTETVLYEFRSEVEVPASVAADEHELHEYLDENESLWLDDLDPTGKNSAITERTLDEVCQAQVEAQP